MTSDEPVTPTGVAGSSPLLRLRLDFGYDGTRFSGWAAQPGRRTIEAELSLGLATVLGSPSPVRLTVAGRTDAGVHARGAVAHTDIDRGAWESVGGRSDRPPGPALRTRLAGVLPADIVVRTVGIAPDGFDARFSALSRRYRYRICDRSHLLDPLRRWDTVVHRRELDADAVNVACGALLGLADFAAFCKRRDGATTIRTLLAYSWRRATDGTLEATVVADAFCHSMVRSLVGAVVPVGEGRRAVGWPAQVLRGGHRDPGVTVMPAHGLCLEQVTYPPDAQLGARAEQARGIRTLGGERPTGRGSAGSVVE